MKLQKVQNEIKIERKKEGVIPFTASVINLPKRQRERAVVDVPEAAEPKRGNDRDRGQRAAS